MNPAKCPGCGARLIHRVADPELDALRLYTFELRSVEEVLEELDGQPARDLDGTPNTFTRDYLMTLALETPCCGVLVVACNSTVESRTLGQLAGRDLTGETWLEVA